MEEGGREFVNVNDERLRAESLDFAIFWLCFGADLNKRHDLTSL